jgi:hypothetical protein
MTERIDEIAETYRRPDESNSEHFERVRACKEQALWFWLKATEPQRAVLRDKYNRWAFDGSPLAKRAIEAAKAEFEASTAEAWAAYLLAFGDLMQIDDIRAGTGELFDALIATNAVRMAEVA